MNKLLPLIFALGFCAASAAYAMPVAPIGQSSNGLTIQVGYRCGLGVHLVVPYSCTRGTVHGVPYDRAYLGGFYRGYHQGYNRGYYAGVHAAHYPYVRFHGGDGVIAVDSGVCGFGSYLSCSYGMCWRFCY